MENEDRLIGDVTQSLLEPGELLVDSVVIVSVLDEDGEQYLRMKATPMPWWTLNGMLEAAKVVEDES
jgi:hypothetical protein